jgi:Uma2 family endonuclease
MIAGASLRTSCGAEQIMAMPVHAPRRWTAAAVRQLIADSSLRTPRYELVDGELLVTPSPAPSHQMAVTLMLIALTEYCDRTRAGRALHSPSDIELEPEDIRQPDVYVLPRDEWRRIRDAGFPAHQLLLAVEVVSPSSARFDRVVKRDKYQRFGCEYWIVDADARVVERWSPGDTRPEIVTGRIVWHALGAADAFELDLERFFDRVWSD